MAVGACLLGVFLSARGMNYTGAFGSFAAFVVALVTLVALLGPWIVRSWSGPPFLTSATAADATESLAMMLERQLSQDEQERRINDPWPMPVRWEVSKQAGSAPAAKECTAEIRPDSGAVLSGHLSDIMRAFLNVSSRRLVVLGPAGAGKSILAIKLARDLLASRHDAEGSPIKALPVILPAVSWDPAESLFSWIAAWLSRNYPSLSSQLKGATGQATSVALALVESGRVIPIIDGFDELPEFARAKALVEINAAGSNIPVVLISRPLEYSRAVALVGRPVTRALTIELLPLRPAEVQEYLIKATSEIPVGRWKVVFTRLAIDPHGPLAMALTNPLMLWLCRTIYESGESNPGELADLVRFSDQEAIEDHLLDALIPALYPGVGRPCRRWTASQAERWLAFLADYLDKTRVPYLSWWRLDQAVPAAWRALGAAVRGGLLAAAAWGLAVWVLWRCHEWIDGRYVRHIALPTLLFNGPAGPRLRSFADHFLAWISAPPNIIDSVRWLPALLSIHSLLLFAVTVGAIRALRALFGSAAVRSRNVPPYVISRKMDYGRLVRETLVGVGLFGILLLLIGVSAHLALLFLIVLGILLVSTIAGALISPLDSSESKSPLDAFRADRKSTLFLRALVGLGTTALIWLFCGTHIALAAAVFSVTGLLYGVLFGAMYSSDASLIFTETRLELAFSRCMPMRTMTFLDDAHKRGVLRRAGAVYEFRHIRLQQRLARRRITFPVFAAAVALEVFDIWKSFLASGSGATSNRWLPSSAAPIYWRVWARRFREARAALPRELKLGEPVHGMYWAGPGVAQRYRSADGGGYWTLCALPSYEPVLVAGAVWDRIMDIGTKMTRADALEAFGLPRMDRSVPASERVIGPDATDVMLVEGSWGTGWLVRDGVGSDWCWSVNPGVGGHRLVRTPWSPANVGRRPLRIAAAATIPWHGLQSSIPRQASAGLGVGSRDGALFQAGVALLASLGVRCVPDGWRNTRRKSSPDRVAASFEIASPRRRRALAAEVSLSLRNNDRGRSRKASADITAEVRIDIYDVWPAALAAVQEGRDDGRRQEFLDQLVALFVAAWETAANILISSATNVPLGNMIPATVELKLIVPQRFDVVTHHDTQADQLISSLGFDEYDASIWVHGLLGISREERRSYTEEGIGQLSHWLGLSTPSEWEHSHS